TGNGFTALSSVVGGRDDSRKYDTGLRHDALCTQQDYNSLITVGSFGANATGAFVGLDGDGLADIEPRTGNEIPAEDRGSANSSRLSDELVSIEGSSALATWSFRAANDGD